MKKQIIIAAAALTVGCTTSPETISYSDKEKISISANLDKTRSSFGAEGHKLHWDTYDNLGVYYTEAEDNEWHKYTIKDGIGSSSASFTGDLSWTKSEGDHHFYAFYPYEKTTGEITSLAFSLPAKQSGEFGFYQKNTGHTVISNPISEDGISFNFTPALSLISLNLTSQTPLNIQTITVTAEKPIAGDYTLNIETGEVDSSKAIDTCITISFPEGLHLGSEKQVINVVMLPVDLQGTLLTIGGTTDTGKIIDFSRKGVTLQRGKVYPLTSEVLYEFGYFYSLDGGNWNIWDGTTMPEEDYTVFAVKTAGETNPLTLKHLKVIGDYFQAQTDTRYTLDLSQSDYTTDAFPNIFSGNKQLASIYFPRNTKEVSYAALRYTSLDYVYLPDGVTTIGHNAFVGCGIDEIRIPSSLTLIDQFGLGGNNFKSINLPDGLKAILHAAFNSCKMLTEIVIPNSITQIDAQAFSECDSLRRVYIPDGVTTIKGNLFMKDYLLEEIRLPETIKDTIGGYAFTRCYKLRSIHLAAGVTHIEQFAFSGCLSLETITCNAMTAPTFEQVSGVFGVDNTQKTGLNVTGTKKLIVPAGATGYEDEKAPNGSANYWKTELIDKCGYTIEYR